MFEAKKGGEYIPISPCFMEMRVCVVGWWSLDPKPLRQGWLFGRRSPWPGAVCAVNVIGGTTLITQELTPSGQLHETPPSLPGSRPLDPPTPTELTGSGLALRHETAIIQWAPTGG